MKKHPFPIIFTGLFFTLLGSPAQAENGPTIPLPDEDRAAIEQYLGQGVVGAAIPAPQIVDTTHYLAAGTSISTYRMVSGPDAGKTVQHRRTQMKQDADGVTWRYDAGGKFIYFIHAQADGNYMATGVSDTDAGVITQYSPPAPFMLQGLAPGEERNLTMGVKVADLSNPNDVTHEGSLDVNYRYVGAYKVKVPAGSFDAVLIKWVLKGKVGPASIDDSQYRFLAPNTGIVASVEMLDVSACWRALKIDQFLRVVRVEN